MAKNIYLIITALLIIVSLYKSRYVLKGYSISSKYYMLKHTMQIIDPSNGESIGYLKKGTVIKTPSIHDVNEIENDVKFKLIIEVEGKMEFFNYNLEDKEFSNYIYKLKKR